jgi:nitroreductase
MDQLLNLAVKASTGSGMEPWGFVVINDKVEIDLWSEKIKQYLQENLEQYPYLEQYRSWLTNPNFHVFNRANTLLIIYGNKESHWRTYDCTLAAANVMLAAHEMGIGTCWIGFAEYMLNTEEFKEKYQVPENYELVCPMSIGYMKKQLSEPKRKEPVVFYR